MEAKALMLFLLAICAGYGTVKLMVNHSFNPSGYGVA